MLLLPEFPADLFSQARIGAADLAGAENGAQMGGWMHLPRLEKEQIRLRARASGPTERPSDSLGKRGFPLDRFSTHLALPNVILHCTNKRSGKTSPWKASVQSNPLSQCAAELGSVAQIH